MQQISELDKRELRQFGLITGAITVILFGLILPFLGGHFLPQWPWMVALILGLLAILAPLTLRPIYKVWMRIGLVLGFFNTRIILGLVYYGLLLPMGVIMRFCGKDSIVKKFDEHLDTYRLPCQPKPAALKTKMEKPY